jgi:hypothetical protein
LIDFANSGRTANSIKRAGFTLGKIVVMGTSQDTFLRFVDSLAALTRRTASPTATSTWPKQCKRRAFASVNSVYAAPKRLASAFAAASLILDTVTASPCDAA